MNFIIQAIAGSIPLLLKPSKSDPAKAIERISENPKAFSFAMMAFSVEVIDLLEAKGLIEHSLEWGDVIQAGSIVLSLLFAAQGKK